MAFTFLEDAPVGVTFLDDEPATGVTFLDEPVEPVAPSPQFPAPSFTATMPVKVGQPIGTPQDFATFDPNALLTAPDSRAPSQSVNTGDYNISYAKAAPTNAVPVLGPVNGEWTPEAIAAQNARADELNPPTESALRERSYNEALVPFFQESQGPRKLTEAEWWASQTPRIEAFEPKTFTGEIGKNNIPGAIGVVYKAARESLTGILPPTEEQILNESVPWGTNPDGSVKYEYKPLGSRLDKTGIMTPLLETKMMEPKPDDTSLDATGKATFNFMAGLVNFGLSPLGIATVGLGGATKAATRIAGFAPAGLGAESSVAAQTAARLAATARVVSGGFAIDMASAVPEQYKAATESPTLQGKVEGWLGVVSSLAFATLAAKHAAKKPLELAERQTLESVLELAKRTPDAVLEAVAQNMEVDVYSRNLAKAELQRRQIEQQAALAPEAAAAAESAGTAMPSGTAGLPERPNPYGFLDSQVIQDALDGNNISNLADRAAAIAELEKRQAKYAAGPPDPAATAVGVIKTAAAADAAGKPFSPRIEEPGATPAAPAAKSTARDASKPEQMTPDEWDSSDIITHGTDTAVNSAEIAAGSYFAPAKYGDFGIGRRGKGAQGSGAPRMVVARGPVVSATGGYDRKSTGPIQVLAEIPNDVFNSIPKTREGPTGERVHHALIKMALERSDPVSSAAVDAYGIKLPEGYVRRGEFYVFDKPTKPAPAPATPAPQSPAPATQAPATQKSPPLPKPTITEPLTVTTAPLPPADRPANIQAAKDLLFKLHFETKAKGGNLVQDISDGDTALNITPKTGEKIDAHGISKGSPSAQIDALNELLTTGIDPKRRFDTAPLELSEEKKAGMGAALGTAGGTAYRDGLFIVTSAPGETLANGGVKTVLVNPVGESLIPSLRKAFPSVEFVPYAKAETHFSKPSPSTPAPAPAPIVGERVKIEPTKPKGPEPTAEQTLNEALEVNGDLPSAWESLDNQVKALEGNEANKADIKRLNAAKRKIENTLEEESRRAETEQLEVEQNKGYELLSSIKQLGGLPTLGEKGRYATGELKRIAEASKGAFLRFFRKGAKSLDQLRESLNERGFDFETPEQMLMAIEDSLATGKKSYGSQFPEGYMGGPGAMGPVERAYMEASRKIIGGYNADVEASQIRRGQTPSVSEARKEDPVTFEAAMDAIEKNPALPEKLVEDILKKEKKSITDEEQQILTYRRAELENNMAAESERAIDPSLTPQEQAFHQANAEILEAQLLRAEEANRIAGTASGRALRSRQMQMNEDYTYAGLMMRERKLTGDVVPKERAQEIKKIADEYKKAQAELDLEREARQKLDESAVMEAVVVEMERELEAAAKTGATYHPSVMQHAKEIVERAKGEAADAWKRIRSQMGSESGAVGGVGGPKGEGKYLGQPSRQQIAAQNRATLINDVALILKARVYEFGVKMAEAAQYVLLKSGDMGDSIRPILARAVAKANTMMERELNTRPKKVKEAVKTGATAPEKQPKAKPTPESYIDKGKASVVAGDDPLYRKEIGEAIDGGNVTVETHKLMSSAKRLVYDIVVAHWENGVRGTDALMDAALKTVQEFLPDATLRDVHRAYGEYGKVKFPNKDALSMQLSAAYRETKLMEDIARMERDNKDALRRGFTPAKPNLRQRELASKRAELQKLRQGEPSPEKLAGIQQARQTALKNRMEVLDKMLKTGEKPPKGQKVPDDVFTEQLKSEKEALEAYVKEVEAAKNPPLSEAQKALDAALVARERAAQTLDDLSIGKVKDPVKLKEALTQFEEDVRMETDALLRHANEMRRDAKKPGDPGYAKEQAQIKAFEKSIKDYTENTAKLLRGEAVPTSGKKLGPDSRRITTLREIRNSRSAAYKAAKDVGKPVLSPEQRYNATRLKKLTKREADLRADIAAGRFAAKPKKVNPALDKATIDAELKVDAVKQEYLKSQFDWQMKQRNKPTIAKDAVMEAFSLARATMLSVDLGFMGLQLGTRLITNPLLVLKNMPAAIKAGWGGTGKGRGWERLTGNEQALNAVNKSIELRPEAKNGDLKKMGIDPSTSALKTEYALRGRLADYLPVVAQSNRAMTAALNLVRADLARASIEAYGQGFPIDVKTLKMLGNEINIVTGRGALGKAEMHRAMLNHFGLAPGWVISRFQFLYGQPVWEALLKGDKKAAGMFFRSYVKWAAGSLTLLSTAAFFHGDDWDEFKARLDPRSSRFGMIPIGNRIYDFSSGIIGPLVFLSRFITGERVTKDGEVISLRREDGEPKKFGTKSTTDLAFKFAQGKAAPIPGFILDLASGEDVVGRPANFATALLNRTLPLTPRQMAQIASEEGIPGSVIPALLQFMGVNSRNEDTSIEEGMDYDPVFQIADKLGADPR